jgi:hypothetical protein
MQIVAVLVGVVWGLWVGFGIVSPLTTDVEESADNQVAAGTFLGEVHHFYSSQGSANW